MFDKYQVKENETLKDIASRFNTDVKTLMDINNIYNEDGIRQGIDLVVPKINEDYFNTYTIEKGDSLYKIGEKYNINPRLLASLNGLNMDDYIYPNQIILIPKSGYSYYITAEGDTLSMVSNLFKKDPVDLLKENPTIYLLKDQIIVSKRS